MATLHDRLVEIQKDLAAIGHWCASDREFKHGSMALAAAAQIQSFHREIEHYADETKDIEWPLPQGTSDGDVNAIPK